jgi:hypothetical protein
MPELPSDQSVTSTGFLRFEDVAQDGRLLPIAFPSAQAALWRDVVVDHPGARNALAQGVIPILTRMTIAGSDQPIRVDQPIEVRSGFVLARDGDSAARRLFMNVWCDLRGAGKLGRHSPGQLVPAGTLFSEHTFTRPLAPDGQRRVTELAVEGYPHVPDVVYAAPLPTSAGEPPEGGRWLQEVAADPTEHVLTLDHTDSNQHVNSLVYIRIFLDAAYRRLAVTRRSVVVHSRSVDIAYRRPCFAGDRLWPHLGLFELADRVGAAGFIAGIDGKPRCYVRISFD